MLRRPARCPGDCFGYTAAARRRRWWPARSSRAAANTHAGPRGRRPAPPRPGTPPPAQTRRCAGKCTRGRDRGAGRPARNRRRTAIPRRRPAREDSPGAWSSAAHDGVRRIDGVRGVDLLGDVLERGVPDVLAVHHVDHVLADVLGMIADALQGAHDPHDLERAPDGARVFHHEGDALALNRLIFLVHHLVFLRGLDGRLRVHARKRIQGIVHHLRDLAAQVFDLAILVRRPFHGGEPRGNVADFLALVADALEIGDGLDDGDDHPQIAGRRRPQGQYAAAFLVYGQLHAVDLVVFGRHRLAQAAVALDQGGDRLVQLLLDEAAHLQHLIVDLFQVLV